jgi:hypothetical protein
MKIAAVPVPPAGGFHLNFRISCLWPDIQHVDMFATFLISYIP